VFGAWVDTYRAALPLALPMWLEIAVPVLVAFGVTPLQRKDPAPEPRKGVRKVQGTRKGRARPNYGTAAYWLARLDRDGPDLAKLVRAGALSANGAVIRAGFRKPALRVVANCGQHGPRRARPLQHELSEGVG
jgi:hypothetical protein